MSWTILEENGNLLLHVEGKRYGKIQTMKAGKKPSKIKLMLNGGDTVKLDLTEYEGESNGQRSTFIKKWESKLKVGKNTETKSNQDSSLDRPASTSSDGDSTVGPFDVDPQTDGHSTSGTDERLSDEGTRLGEESTQSVSDVQDAVIRRKLYGSVDVHLDNLVSPEESRATRFLDHEHVGQLQQSLLKNELGQLVVFVGLLKEPADLTRLTEPGAAEVEVLGGNHTRAALQAMRKEGVQRCALVKVQLYRCLTKQEALAVGYQHNLITHEKLKPVSFLDKIRLMRTCKEGCSDSEWKDMLAGIFRAKERRKFLQYYQSHLLMASYEDELYSLVIEACHGHRISEKFFRSMTRLTHSTDIRDCLVVLKEDGTKAFKEKVAECIATGRVRSKRKAKKKVQEQLPVEHEDGRETPMEEGHVEILEEFVDSQMEEDNVMPAKPDGDATLEQKYAKLKLKYKALELENEELRKRLDAKMEMSIESSTGCSTPNQDTVTRTVSVRGNKIDTFQKGEKVLAFWRFDDNREEWLEATVLFVYASGNSKVQFECDKAISTLKPSWIKRK